MNNLILAKKLNAGAWIISGLVLLLVGMMRRVKIPVDVDLSFLPAVNAGINAVTAIILLFSLFFIKQKRVEAHKRSNYAAFVLSAFFLLFYVSYHFTTPETIYGDLDGSGFVEAAELEAVGVWRTIYLAVLASHIILAAGIFPFILFTFIRGYTGQIERHRKMARWVWPIWFYVAVTGPVVYLMLRPYY